MTPGIYVYGIVRRDALAHPPHATAVDPREQPALFESGDLTAVVSRVDVSEFEGETLRRNVESPEWLEEKVRAHECVLDEVLAATTVVPMRFGSIFSSAAGLEAMLAEHGAALHRAIERVDGRTEWGVKVHCDRNALVEALAGGSTEAGSGRSYLLQKKARLEAETRAAEAAAAVAAEVHASLAEVADGAVVTSGGAGGAYLVPDGDREDLMRRVEELHRRHAPAFVLEVTGPWPPYNFVSADVGGPRP